MRIAIADSNARKFCNDIIVHWEKKGHEVRYEIGSSEFLAQWADLYFCDDWDNNLGYLYRLYHGLHSEMPLNWNNDKKPIIVVRPLDWTVWLGHARDQAVVDWVDKVICIAPHIEKKLRAEANFRDGQLKLIRPGLNLEKFTFKTKQTDGYQIGMVLGDMWWYKNHMGGLDIFAVLAMRDPHWMFHIRGQHERGDYNSVMFNHYLESRGIKDRVILYDYVEDINSWYENIDYLLHPGMKEAFCYAVGEAMAKGIKPVVNNFYGAEKIWTNNILYNAHAQAIYMFNYGNPIRPNMDYRKFIEENYSLERMLREMDEFLGT